MIIKIHTANITLGTDNNNATAITPSVDVFIELGKSERKVMEKIGVINRFDSNIKIPKRLIYQLYTSDVEKMEKFSPDNSIYSYNLFNDSVLKSFLIKNKLEFKWNKSYSNKLSKSISDYVKNLIKERVKTGTGKEYWTTEYHSVLENNPDLPDFKLSDEPSINLDTIVELRIGSDFYNLTPDSDKSKKYKQMINRVVRDIKDQAR